MIQNNICKKGLVLLYLGLSTGAFAQSSLKFESGGGPTGNGPSTTSKVVTMYNGDGAVYSPSTTVTYSLSNQQYPSIEGNPGVPGMLFGAGNNTGVNSPPAAMPFYELLNAVGSSSNAMYATDGATPAINVANDYGVHMFLCADALINADGTNKVATNTKTILFGRLTLTFNRPVTNPIIHITGLGGHSSNLGLSASFVIASGGTITRLNGNSFFTVSGGAFYNSAATYAASSANTTAPAGASGSIRINSTNITSVAFDVYMNGDGGGSIWSDASKVTGDGFLISTSLSAYDINGTVFNDNNAGTPNGTVPPGTTVTLYAANGTTVIATTTTDASGNYSFPNQLSGNYIVGVTPPAGYQNVSSTDATPTDGRTSVTVGSANATGVNFGINQPPTATNDTLINQTAGTPATVPNLLGNDTDPNTGSLSAGSISLVTPSGASNPTTDANGHVTGFTVPGQGTWTLNSSTGAVTFTPQAGYTGDPTPINYTVTDAAGLTSNQATISIDYNNAGLSGNVFNDANGSTIDGTPTNAGGTLNMLLVDGSGNLVATVPVSASGQYNFDNVPSGNYTLRLSTTAGMPGQPAPAASLPAGWSNTAEGTTASGDGTANGNMTITVVTTALNNLNFGIERLPESYPVTKMQTGMPSVTNLGSNPLQGSDPEDQSAQGSWSGKTIVIDTLPTNGYILKYNGTVVTAGTPISNYDPALLTIEPGASSGGTSTTTFKYATIDAAGKKDPSPAAYTVNWSVPLPVQLLSFSGSTTTCAVDIVWLTGKEDQLQHFAVQRSKDGRSYETIAVVAPQGSNSSYHYRDEQAGEGARYYRLAIIDVIKAVVYSPVLSFKTNCPAQRLISIYPNPVTDKVSIEGLNAAETIISLYSTDGKLVKQQTVKTAKAVLDLSGLANGLYRLLITGGGSRKSFNLIKR